MHIVGRNAPSIENPALSPDSTVSTHSYIKIIQGSPDIIPPCGAENRPPRPRLHRTMELAPRLTDDKQHYHSDPVNLNRFNADVLSRLNEHVPLTYPRPQEMSGPGYQNLIHHQARGKKPPMPTPRQRHLSDTDRLGLERLDSIDSDGYLKPHLLEGVRDAFSTSNIPDAVGGARDRLGPSYIMIPQPGGGALPSYLCFTPMNADKRGVSMPNVTDGPTTSLPQHHLLSQYDVRTRRPNNLPITPRMGTAALKSRSDSNLSPEPPKGDVPNLGEIMSFWQRHERQDSTASSEIYFSGTSPSSAAHAVMPSQP